MAVLHKRILARLLPIEADISSPLNNAKGFITRNQGLLINSGNIDFTTGTDNIGVWVDNGRFENTGSRIAVNGVALFVEGEHVSDYQHGRGYRRCGW
ncbi:hypothetical protein O5623_28745 [Escherichia coli]|nr:hypothetical protein [Escherichia coli]